MNTSLLADHQQPLHPADNYHALPSPNFCNASFSNPFTPDTPHTLNGVHPSQCLSLDTAQFPSKVCSFHGDPQSQAQPAQYLSPSLSCGLDGEPQKNTPASPKPDASQLSHSFSASQLSCVDYAGRSSSSTSTPRSCINNSLQKDPGDGERMGPISTLRASECDYAERIHELHAALLRRNVCKPSADLMQNIISQGELPQVNKWAMQQQAVGSQKDERGNGSLRGNTHLQPCNSDIGDHPDDYLSSLRAAASSFGGITYQSRPDAFHHGSNLVDRANKLYMGSRKPGGFMDQGQEVALSGGFNQISLDAFDRRQEKPTVGGLNDVKQAVGSLSTTVVQASVASGRISQASFKDTAFVNNFSHSCTSSNQDNRGSDESSVGSCIDPISQDSTINGSAEASAQDTAAIGGLSQDNRQAAHSDLNQHSVSRVGQYNQASMRGLGKIHQAFAGSFSTQTDQNSSDGFNQASHDSLCNFNSGANKASSYTNQASVGGVNPGDFLIKDRTSSESGDVQAAQHKCYGNGDLTDLERLQVEEGESGASNELSQEESYLGDLQASITAQEGSLLRFLPSNEEEVEFAEEELQLGGALFGCDEFRMYEFKVRLCMRERSHDWTQCPFAHPGEKARRRDPRVHHYSAVPCPDFRKAVCKRGDACELSHGVFECWLHPSRYRTQICKDGKLCKRKVCFFAHSPSQFRAISNSSSQIQNMPLPSPKAVHLSNAPDLSALDESSLRLPIQLLQHLDPRCYQALLKHESYASHLTNHHLNIYPAPNLIHSNLCQIQQGSTEAAAALSMSQLDGRPSRLAVAYGLPINLDAASLEAGFNSTPSNNGQFAVSPQCLNMPPRIDPYHGSTLLHSNHASAGSFSSVKAVPSANYTNLSNYNGISMHGHSVYGASPNIDQSDGSRIRALQAGPMDAIARQYLLNEALALQAHNNNINTQHTALSNSGVHLPTHPSAPTLSSTDLTVPRGLPSNFLGCNNPFLDRTGPLNIPTARSLDAVSHAQAILAAHALAQNLPSDYHGHPMPLSPTTLQVRNPMDGTKGAVNPLSGQLSNLDLANVQHLQNAMRSLDSPQAMSQLLASIQQLEMRCANAEIKNSLMMAQASFMKNAKAHQAESWDGHENEGSPYQRLDPVYQRLDPVESMKGARPHGMLQQDAATLMPDQKGGFDLGWVNELI